MATKGLVENCQILYQHGQSNEIKPIVFHLKNNVDNGDTVLGDLVKIYKN